MPPPGMLSYKVVSSLVVPPIRTGGALPVTSAISCRSVVMRVVLVNQLSQTGSTEYPYASRTRARVVRLKGTVTLLVCRARAVLLLAPARRTQVVAFIAEMAQEAPENCKRVASGVYYVVGTGSDVVSNLGPSCTSTVSQTRFEE